jgi:hypothetical protein
MQPAPPRLLVAVLVVIALNAACTGDGGGEATSTATASGTPSPAGSAVATSAPSATPTAARAIEPPRSILVRSGQHVVRLEPGGLRVTVAEELLDAIPADELAAVTGGQAEPEQALGVVIDDLAGGLVYQVGEGIFHLAAGSQSAVRLVTADDITARVNRRIKLLSVERPGSARSVVFTLQETRGPQDASVVMRTLELYSGRMSGVATVGGWESGPHRASYGAGTYVVASSGEGSTWTSFLQADGAPLDVSSELSSATKGCDVLPVGPCVFSATISPLGETVVLLRQAASGGLELALVEMVSGAETATAAIEGSLEGFGLWFDGRYALANSTEGVVIVDFAGHDPIAQLMSVSGRAIGLPGARVASDVSVQDDSPDGIAIEVFFSHHPESDENPGRVFPVERHSPDLGVARYAIEQLMAGPTPAEAAGGYFSEWTGPYGSDSDCGGDRYRLSIEEGVATVRFCVTVPLSGVLSDGRMRTTLTATLEQFSTVERVVILRRSGDCLFDLSGNNPCLEGANFAYIGGERYRATSACSFTAHLPRDTPLIHTDLLRFETKSTVAEQTLVSLQISQSGGGRGYVVQLGPDGETLRGDPREGPPRVFSGSGAVADVPISFAIQFDAIQGPSTECQVVVHERGTRTLLGSTVETTDRWAYGVVQACLQPESQSVDLWLTEGALLSIRGDPDGTLSATFVRREGTSAELVDGSSSFALSGGVMRGNLTFADLPPEHSVQFEIDVREAPCLTA